MVRQIDSFFFGFRLLARKPIEMDLTGGQHSGRATVKWRKKPGVLQNYRLPLFLVFFVFALYVLSRAFNSPSLLPVSSNSRAPIRAGCGGPVGGFKGKFLWYPPHSGFSNQLSEFKNAVLMAAILNRTLVVPPILDHHAVALGSCPKFRVLDPNELRFRVWNHCIELIRDRRQVRSQYDFAFSP